MREYPAQKRRKKKKKASRGMIFFELILLCLILLVVFRGDALYKLAKQMMKIENLNLVRTIQIPYSGRNTLAQSSVFRANENIVICEENSLKVYTRDGVLAFEGALNADSTLVDGGSTFYVIAESQRGELVTVDYKGNILNTIKDIGALQEVEIFEDTYILAKLQDQKTVQLYSNDLISLMSVVIPTGQILETKVFMQAQTIAIAAIETEGNILGTTIYQYSFEGKLLGITNFDSEIVYSLFADDKLHALTDTAMYTLTSDGVVIQKDTYEGVLHAFSSIPGGILLFTEAFIEDVVEDLNAFNFQTYEWKTYVLKTISMEMVYSQFFNGEKYMVALSESTIGLYDQAFSLKATMTNDLLYTNGFWLSPTQFLLFNDTTADIFNIAQ